jgi:hypothetical protein
MQVQELKFFYFQTERRKHLCDITSICAFTTGNKTLKLNTLPFSLSLTSFAISLVVFATVFCGKEVSLNSFAFSGHKASYGCFYDSFHYEFTFKGRL